MVAADQTADVGMADLAQFVRLYPFPDFVKKADIAKIMERRPAEISSYADPAHRQFPCDTSASTWMSALYFLNKRAAYEPGLQTQIQQRLDHYIDYWQIRDAYSTLLCKHAALIKVAEAELPDDAFAWVWKDAETGQTERRLRLTNSLEVKAATDWLVEHRQRMPYRVRNGVAKRIKAAQLKYGTALGQNEEFIERQAGRGVCAPAAVVQQCRRRADMAKSATDKAAMVKLAATVAGSVKAALQPQMLTKLACLIDDWDRRTGLFEQYDGTFLMAPEDVLFSATFAKTAEALCEHVATTTGAVFQKNALSKLALDDLVAIFGDEFGERVRSGLGVDVTKLAEELTVLPYPDARQVEGLLQEKGVLPVMRKAASVRVGFNQAQLQVLAGDEM